MPSGDTIAAIATAPGRAGIGVVRVSGELAAEIARSVLGRVPEPRRATLVRFRDAGGATLDQGLALYFVGPHSYTGENMLELQGHGGDAVLRLLLERCLELGARLAEPGEFTKRAFLNDKIDLAQAEGVADLIEAATSEAAKSAARSLSGEFSQRVQELVDALIELRTLIEATLDFPDEEIDLLNASQAADKLADIERRLEQVLASARQGSLLRSGMQVVLLGRPNVGKSSLLNRLAGQNIAIVTPVPGTTRDALREVIQIEGVPLHIVDTAGLRATTDEVEQIGIDRTWQVTEAANVALLVIDVTTGFTPEDEAIIVRFPQGLDVLRVFNKIDLIGAEPSVIGTGGERAVYLSAKTGAGVELLRRELLRVVGWRPSEEAVFAARARHLAALNQAQARVAAGRTRGGQLELQAEELRLAQRALSSITGEFTADDLLGQIFSRFCIGK